jgi:vanillate O-demethylase ferredoxin subunit
MNDGLHLDPPRTAADPLAQEPETVSFAAEAEPQILSLRVQAVRFEAETIRSFELVSLDGTELPPFTAGAHIDLALPGALSRSYSLINSQDERHRYVIAVNRDVASRGGSLYMCETLRVGDVLSVTAPRNTFPLDENAPLSVLFAGGIGITPMLSMVRRLEAIGRPWELYYAVRSYANGAFLAEFAGLEALSPGRVHLHVDSEAGTFMALPPLMARVRPDAHLYCCGPTPMIDAFKAAASSRPQDNIHVEHFVGTAEKTTSAFTVVLKRSNREFQVPAGETIMGVLMQAGLRVPHSCREGICGTCETRVFEGVPDHKDNVLSPREQASNKVIMICCSGAKTDKLVIDL